MHKITKKTYTREFIDIITHYANTPTIHKNIWESFYQKTNHIDALKRHRDYIEKNEYGYGDRPFHYMWKLLVDQMPQRFSFLEIGVFKGQVLSLIALLASMANKQARIYGVTPLTDANDKYSHHPNVDYVGAIQSLYEHFHLSFRDTRIIQGFSQQPTTVRVVRKISPFDLVFIDGSHDYEDVKADLTIYPELVAVGGFIVVDDAATFLQLPSLYALPPIHWYEWIARKKELAFAGFPDVANAVRDTIEKDGRFIHLFACGHDRVWQRQK